MSYKYDMPGEVDVGQQELWFFKRGTPNISKLDVKKWKDQRLMSIHFPTGMDTIRLVRRDRLQRNLDVVDVDVAGSGTAKTLFSESLENAALEPRQIAFTRKGGDMIWWSERSGWGQYYLSDSTGKYKHPLTTGSWHAESIAGIDSVKGVVWIGAEGKEAGENPYYRHYYRVNADGTGLTLVDEGNFSHSETLSPTKKYMVDNFSRIDVPTKAVVRDPSGKVVMNLEEVDVPRLKEMGWKPPETFQVKSADGVTDIYGDMWKPFDFDSTKKYPIIAYVYPSPQTESISFTFAAGGPTQQLAQLGFIVIEIGNRGGSPQRSLAYYRYGYYNLRDYRPASSNLPRATSGSTSTKSASTVTPAAGSSPRPRCFRPATMISSRSACRAPAITTTTSTTPTGARTTTASSSCRRRIPWQRVDVRAALRPAAHQAVARLPILSPSRTACSIFTFPRTSTLPGT